MQFTGTVFDGSTEEDVGGAAEDPYHMALRDAGYLMDIILWLVKED